MRSVHPEPGEVRRQFEEEVFPAEIAYIGDRRESVEDERSLEGPAPTTQNGLVGLALSGGGIRSASFSLGFLQSMGERLFRRIDYLSTVSGGGFIGSAVTALMANSFYRGRGAAFPFAPSRGVEEPEPLSHLRNNSNYMAPGGPADLLRLLAVLVRGILLNSLSLFPFLLLVCLIVMLIYGQQLSDRARFDDQERQIDALLERYIGDRLEREREIDALLEVLEAEALLRIDEGKERGDVIHQLRPAFSFGQGTAADLITGNGRESPFRLRPGAGRRELARALLEGDVLQRYEVIEEVALLARLLEQDGYRHPEAGPFSVDRLLESLRDRALVRPDTRPGALHEFLESYRELRLKPVLQALYNGEYLNAAALGRLVRQELEREPYYAFGWYAARVGQPFGEREPDGPQSWYRSHPWQRARVSYEINLLVRPFASACAKAIREAPRTPLPDDPGGACVETPAQGGAGEGEGGGLLSFLQQDSMECFRPGTTLCDLRRLLEFEELDSKPAATRAIVETLYFGEYLDEQWVRDTLRSGARESESRRLTRRLIDDGLRRCPLPSRPECCALPTGLPSPECGPGLSPDGEAPQWSWPTGTEELFSRLTLAEETVPADLREILRGTPCGVGAADCEAIADVWPPFVEPDADIFATMLAALLPKLDDDWVRSRLYVYSYGWHRGRVGKAHPAAWCDGALAGRGAAGCPEASDEAWGELSRASRDPSRWDPNRLTLPFTWMAVRLALGWILLFPLLVIGARAVYRRRQAAVREASNPLDALRSRTGFFDRPLDWRGLYEHSFGLLLAGILGVGLIELLPYAVHHFHYLELREQSAGTLVIGAASLLVTALAGPALALLRRFGRLVAMALLAIAGPLLLLTVFVYAMEHAVYSPPPLVDRVLEMFGVGTPLWFVEGGRRLLSVPSACWLFLLVALASVAVALVIDINATSLHGLYRDRITKAFMVGQDTEGNIEPEEDLALTQICPDGSGAPYHLLNVALNLQGSGDRSLRGRNAAFLFFSRDHVGGPRTGFCRTEDMARVFPHTHLASAMAVSGAAVSPNMGRYRSGPLAILLALLNTRLALWMPHPGAVRRWFGEGDRGANPLVGAWRRFRLRAPATRLLWELFGAVHDEGPVVNVSDGGHIENTGALELLRRRCREIVIVDGEADPEMAFGGLARLQRIARLDMGIEIEIDLDELRPDEHGLSRRRSASGTIHYPAVAPAGDRGGTEAETGRLLYVKLAVTGDEDETVAEYRARNESFPHESTGDQAFDEGQLEAYRALGQLAGREALGTAGDWEPTKDHAAGGGETEPS